jgi:peptidoglycan/LPS O-acetylase OafA/YrhL
VRFSALGTGAGFVLLSEGLGGDAMDAGFFVAGSTLLAVCFAGVVIDLLAHPKTVFSRLLMVRPVVFWGGISFCVYLVHHPVNSLLHGLLLQDWPQTIALSGVAVTLGSVVVAALLGVISRRWFEGPIVAWSRRVIVGRRGAADVVPKEMPDEYAPPMVRWTRGVAGVLFRPTLRVARAVVRVR